MTIAKAERAEDQPKFLVKYTKLDDSSEYLERLLKSGYQYCLGIQPGAPITVGSLESEWRQLGTAIFFFKQPLFQDVFKKLKLRKIGAEIPQTIPTIEFRKFYSNMLGCGRGWYRAVLTPDDVMEWISFFEAKEARFAETIDVLGNGRFPWGG